MKNFLVCSVLLLAFFNNRVQGKCNPLCGTGVYTHAGTCQPSGRCLCFWGWTGPNAQYTTDNRILADYCRIPCHYTPDYKNPDCVNSNQTGECKVPTSTTPTKPCDPKCRNPPYFGRGICLSDGRCLCWWGWTGPNACYVEDGTYRNRIIADYCAKACHFTPYVRNPKCLNGSWDGEQVTKTTEKTPTEVQITAPNRKCNPLCGTGVYTHAGTCQPSGRCLCFWGWTGPNAQYTTNNRILADYCRIPCHYTPDYKNPDCVNSNQTGKCKVPTSTTPTKPCDPKCGNPPYHGRGICLSDGRCLCWWGWTGPNACYVEDGTYRNRIIADYCAKACHFTPYVRNPKCLNGSWDGEQVTKTTEKTPTEVQTTAKVPCDPLCGTGVYTHAGTCQPDGRCLCAYGWTGPHAQYTAGNRILADYCRVPCHYTHDYENPECVNSNHTGDECKVPDSTTPTTPCDPRCGKPPYYGKGQCLSNGRCLCWWGWTGPNACYVEDGSYKNRLIADYCVAACHYTPVVRNGTCLNGTWPPVVKARAIGRQVARVKKDLAVKCDPKCGTGVYTHAGTCQDDGRCLCFWGWTGPNAKYTTNNKILADYCRIPCHYTYDYANPECANSNHTKHECVLPAKSDPKVPCDQRCGNPPNHGKGWCLRNGRCLCWWGWTGPDACYIDGGHFNNRILADYCERPCHYTHDVRNATCLNLNRSRSEIAKRGLNGEIRV